MYPLFSTFPDFTLEFELSDSRDTIKMDSTCNNNKNNNKIKTNNNKNGWKWNPNCRRDI